MRVLPPFTMIAAAMLALGCATAPAQNASLAPLEAAADALPSLDLSFRDPSGGTAYRIVGPYRVVAANEDGIELAGTDPDFDRDARVLLFSRGEALWALAKIDGRAFLTRVN